MCLLAFIFPIFGLIYWCFRCDKRPKTAYACVFISIAQWLAGVMLFLLLGIL